jgi:hypothetical protein
MKAKVPQQAAQIGEPSLKNWTHLLPADFP